MKTLALTLAAAFASITIVSLATAQSTQFQQLPHKLCSQPLPFDPP